MNPDYMVAENSLLHLYRRIPLYYRVAGDDFALYKPAGVTLSEMRIREQMLPKRLYIQIRNKIEAIQEVQNFLNKELKRCVETKNLTGVKKTLNEVVRISFKEPKSGSLEGLSKTVNILVGDVVQHIDLIRVLVDLTSKDYTTVRHSVNVMSLAIGYAAYSNYDKYQARILGLSALLHDIGKVRIDSSLLKAPRKLSEEEFIEIRKHPAYGFHILNACKFSQNEIKMTALEHHEKLDGSGYPDQKTNISEHAQVVGIIDCYEALTNDERLYRKAVDPLKALETIKREIVDAGKFSRDLFKRFAYSLLQIYGTQQSSGEPVRLQRGDRMAGAIG
jgi:HD-GYP domain-containing protein (c-di-GMP phosphodiesterase class II)